MIDGTTVIAALSIWGVGFVFLFLVVTDGPPYPSRDSLAWVFTGALLWPLLLVAVPLMLLCLNSAKEK